VTRIRSSTSRPPPESRKSSSSRSRIDVGGLAADELAHLLEGTIEADPDAGHRLPVGVEQHATLAGGADHPLEVTVGADDLADLLRAESTLYVLNAVLDPLDRCLHVRDRGAQGHRGGRRLEGKGLTAD
jgi:hypothetical protein